VVSLDFSVTYSFRPHHDPGVGSAPSEIEYQEHFLGVKAACAWGWQPHHHRVPNVMKSGSLNLLEPSGSHRACYGTPLDTSSTSLMPFQPVWYLALSEMRVYYPNTAATDRLLTSQDGVP